VKKGENKMIIPINKIGNLEFENNTAKYRLPITEFNTDELSIIEKNIKRKVRSLEGLPYYLLPYEIQIINSSVIFYYELVNYKSFHYLRQLDFKEQLKYFASLVEIAKRHEETRILWDMHNFVVDPYEEITKVLIYESENIKIYEKTDALNGVKELILISLTTLNKILGKPTKMDFINRRDDIIQFAETILKIDNLEDLDHYINTRRIEYEHGMVEVEPEGSDERQTPVQGDRNTLFRIKLPKINMKQLSKRKDYNNPNGKKKGSDKTVQLAISILILSLVLNNVLSSQTEEQPEKKEKVVTENVQGNIDEKRKVNKSNSEDLLEAYRLSLNGETKKALNILEGIGFNNLPEKDQEIMLDLYQDDGQYHKVIDLSPSRVKDIVNLIIANGEEEKLHEIKKKMKTKNAYVEFEVAHLNQEWQKIIELKDKVELNGRREQQIVEAYIALDKLDEAEEFATKVGNPDLLANIKELKSN